MPPNAPPGYRSPVKTGRRSQWTPVTRPVWQLTVLVIAVGLVGFAEQDMHEVLAHYSLFEFAAIAVVLTVATATGHELIHYVGYRVQRIPASIHWGDTLSYCYPDGTFVTRSQQAVVLIAPIVSLSGLSLALLIYTSVPWLSFVAATVFTFNTTVASHDLWSFGQIIRLPRGTLLWFVDQSSAPVLYLYWPNPASRDSTYE